MAGDSFGAIAEAYVRLRSKADGSFEKDAREQIMPGVKRLAEDAALLWAGKKLFDVGKAGLAEFKEAEVVAAQTASAIKATGGAAGVSAGQVGDLAGSLSELSGKDDELIAKGANLLLTFKNVKNGAGESNQVFDRATKAALDLSTAGFGSVESASVLMGKALNDPIKGLTALGRSGVTFSDSQKEVIKRLVETGDLLGAQKIILGEVESQVGGAAEAYGKTLAGSLERAQTSLDNAKASLVQGFAPAIQLGADLTAQLASGLQKLPPELQAVAGGALFLGGTFASVARPVADLLTIIDKLRAARLAAAGAETVETATTTAKTAADLQAAAAAQAMAIADVEAALAAQGLTAAEIEAALGAEALAAAEAEATVASTSLAASIALIVAPIALAAAAWYGINHQTSLSVDAMKAAKTPTDELIRGLSKLGGVDSSTGLKTFQQIAEGSIGTAKRLRDQYAAQGQDVTKLDEIIRKEALAQQQATSDTQAATGAVDEYGNALGDTTDAVDKQKVAIDDLNGRLEAAKTRYEEIVTAAHGLLPASQRVQTGVLDIADAQQRAADAADKLAKAQAGTPADADAIASANLRAAQSQQELVDIAADQAKAEKDLADARKGGKRKEIADAEAKLADVQAHSGLKVTKAQQDLADAQRDANKAAGEGADPDKVAQAQRDVERANANVVKTVNDQAEAMAELKAEQDAANGIVETAADKERNYYDALVELNGNLTGPAHDALAAHIADLDAAKRKLDEIYAATGKLADVDWKGKFGEFFGTAADLGLYAAANREGQKVDAYTPPGGVRKFGSGGWVDAPRGMPVPAIVHGGEYVENENEARRGRGGTITNHNTFYITSPPEPAAREVTRHMRRMAAIGPR